MTGKKADLHVHSLYSRRPSSWILRKIGCSESYTSPHDLYSSAKKKGMDYVTITDHNMIKGALEIAHLPDTFISEEITSYFPEDGCKIHVLAWNITEKQHYEISKLRSNIYELCTYLYENNIPNGAAHPLYSINDRLTTDHFEKMLILFKNFELNGTRDAYQNSSLLKILGSLTPGDIERFENRHNLKSLFQKPWQKQITGGSDDHSGLNIASKYTKIAGAKNLESYLEALIEKPADSDIKITAEGKDSSPAAMAHNLYSIIYQFYKKSFSSRKYILNDPVFIFLEKILSDSNHESLKNEGLKRIFTSKKYKPESGSGFEKTVLKEARELLLNTADLTEENSSNPDKSDLLFKVAEKLSGRVLKKLADQSLENISRGDLFSIFQTIGSSASLYTVLSPYFIGYGLFTKDRAFCRQCSEKYLTPHKNSEENTFIAYFTDTFEDINGVAKTLEQQAEISEKLGMSMEIISCGEKRKNNAVNFTPVDKFAIPGYGDLNFYYPPFLKMLDYCYSKNFTHIHAVTPGPLGLAALGISKILNKPLYATYHTAFPQYVKAVTNDSSLEEMAWKYMIWFYNQTDTVYVPSKAVEKELIEKGVEKKKIVFYPRGIDTEQFSPDKKDMLANNKFKIPSEKKKLIYAGRLSKEKNLDDLAETFKQLCLKRSDIHLIIAGDGPYRNQFEKLLLNLPVTYTGFISTEDLASIYASSDILIFPSTTDTFGNVVLEAQASGIPAVVTDKGGPMENIINNKTGLIVKAGDISDFVSAVEKLCDNEDLLKSMKKEARKYMETRSFADCHKKLFMLYKDFSPEKAA